MKKLVKYLLASILAFCCIIGLAACGGTEQKTYTDGLFALTNYDLYKDGQKAGDDVINKNNVGDTSQYFIKLDNDGNMKIVFIDLSVSTSGDSAGKYNLSKSDEYTYTYYINSSNKIVVKDGDKTISYDMTIDEPNAVITLKSEVQSGAQVVSKFEIAD